MGTMRALFSKGFWTAEETPRWALVLGAVLTIIFSFCSNSYLQHAARVDDKRAADIATVFQSMVEFQVYASAFSTEILREGQVSNATRLNLIKNLDEQFARSRVIESAIPKAAPEIDAYRKNIVAMIEAVNKTKDVNSMKDFWTAASNLLVARNNLSSQLHKEI